MSITALIPIVVDYVYIHENNYDQDMQLTIKKPSLHIGIPWSRNALIRRYPTF